MGKLVGGIFGSSSNRGMEQEAARQRELNSISQARAEQSARENSDAAAAQMSAGKNVRGRRLLSGDNTLLGAA